MKDMSELERRISAALDRISTHVTTLQRPPPAPEPVIAQDDGLPAAAELKAELEAERAVTAQLEERVRAIKEKQDTKVTSLESDLAAARNRIAALEEDLETLREAGEAPSAEEAADLRVELDALRAERATERAELADLLAQLQPIVEESAGA
ncbi:MAG: hypothetical protein GW905_10970 [Rhodobacterales bacterium]|nr:hypothetical protein [Rhodobacterales bacterium]